MDWEIFTWQFLGGILSAFALGVVFDRFLSRSSDKDRFVRDSAVLSARDEEIGDLKEKISKNLTDAAAKTDLSALQTENDDLKARIAEFDNAAHENLSLKKENENLKAQFLKYGAETDLEIENAKLKARIAAIKSSAKADLESYRAEINRLKINNPAFESEIASKFSVCKNENANLKAKIFSLETDLSDFKTRLAVVTATSTVSRKAVAAASSRYAAAGNSEQGFQTRLASLKSTVDDGFDDDYGKIKMRLDALEFLATDEEEDTEENLNAWTAETASLQARIAALKSRANSEERESRRAELDADAVSLAEILRQNRADKDEGIAKIRRQGYEKGVRDDLKEIEGVGPVLEKLLNDLDIWTFKQIACWSPEKITEVSRHLPSFKDRIGREGWVEQSSELHFSLYGEEL